MRENPGSKMHHTWKMSYHSRELTPMIVKHDCWFETMTLVSDWKKSYSFQQFSFPIFDTAVPTYVIMLKSTRCMFDSLAAKAVNPGGWRRMRGRSGAWPPPWEGPCPSCSPKSKLRALPRQWIKHVVGSKTATLKLAKCFKKRRKRQTCANTTRN